MGMADWEVALGTHPAFGFQQPTGNVGLRVPEGGMKRRLSEAEVVVVDFSCRGRQHRYPFPMSLMRGWEGEMPKPMPGLFPSLSEA